MFLVPKVPLRVSLADFISVVGFALPLYEHDLHHPTYHQQSHLHAFRNSDMETTLPII